MKNKISITAYSPVLYGKEYFKASLESLKDHVDKFVILYTPQGSQGYLAKFKNPDSKEELYQIASDTLGNKLVWSEKIYNHESEHRNHALSFCSDTDILVGADVDEIFESDDLEDAFKTVYDGKDRQWGVNGFINFWKSFENVLIDQFRPIRFTNLNNVSGQGEVKQRIYHFSCAQNIETIKFKWETSGHRAELFPDWLSKYTEWTPGCDIEWLHPASHQIWRTPEFFDKTTLPEILKNHPNYNLDLIP